MATVVEAQVPDASRAARATRWIFLICGLATGTWAPVVPYVKLSLGLSEATLGTALLGIGLGGIVAMPLAGILVHRYGSRNVVLATALCLGLIMPLLGMATSLTMLVLILVAFGAAVGALDVAMNAQAVVVEMRSQRRIMSGVHALYSIGGLIGAAGVSVLLTLGLPLAVCLLLVMVTVMAVALRWWRLLLPPDADVRASPGARFVWPSGKVVALGLLCFVAFLAEGSMLDWSAVFLKFSRDVPASAAGAGYAAFAVAMALGRLFGDRFVQFVGPVRAVQLGALVAGSGLMLAVLAPWASTALLGFALVGLGASNVVPVFFSAAGRIPGVSASVAIPAMTTLGYSGVLAGPALVGYLAHASSLGVALGVVAGLMFVVAGCARVVRP